MPEDEAPEATGTPAETDTDPDATEPAATEPAATAGDAVEEELDPAVEALVTRVRDALGDAVVEVGDALGTVTVRVRPEAWRHTAEVARRQLDCDYLSFVSGIDWAPAPREGDEAGGDTSSPVQPDEMTFGVAGSAGRFQVFAHVQSTANHHGITFKTDVDEVDPVVESWVSTYPGADWHERECWEMYGIRFDGHPSLRHLYLPSGFEGHPLRKDFPLLARVVKPWPGLVDVEGMPEEPAPEPAAVAAGETSGAEESGESA